jgi:hypothetical protein
MSYYVAPNTQGSLKSITALKLDQNEVKISGIYRNTQLVEALRYNPKGRGLDSRCCHWEFTLT